MGEKSRIRFIVIIAVILAAAVVYSFAANHFQTMPSVTLADVGSGPGGGETDAPLLGEMIPVDITPDTVQNVIATLDRYGSYSRTVVAEYLDGGETVGTLTAAVSVDGGWTRCDVTDQAGRTEHSIVGDAQRWLWYEGDYVCTPAQRGADDLAQRMPTYEDVLEADRADITAAGYVRRGELPCIYVEVAQRELDYLERFWVSVDSGLLAASETVKGEEVVYRMSAYGVESPLSAGEDRFVLPDGVVLHQVEG